MRNVSIFVILFSFRIFNLLANDLSAKIYYSAPGQCTGSIDLMINGGYAPYEVTWTTPQGIQPPEFSNGNDGPEDLYDLCPGEYCVEVTDALCGVASICFTVKDCAEITNLSNLVLYHPSSCNASDGYIRVLKERANKGSGSCQSCTFYLEDAQGNFIPKDNSYNYSGLSAGKYYHIAVDEYGCKGFMEIELIGENGLLGLFDFCPRIIIKDCQEIYLIT